MFCRFFNSLELRKIKRKRRINLMIEEKSVSFAWNLIQSTSRLEEALKLNRVYFGLLCPNFLPR